MFNARAVLERLKRSPFVPIRITTSDGNAVEVAHPDMVLVSQNFVDVGVPSQRDPEIAASVRRIAILHITSMEDLPPRRPKGGNGRTSQRR